MTLDTIHIQRLEDILPELVKPRTTLEEIRLMKIEIQMLKRRLSTLEQAHEQKP